MKKFRKAKAPEPIPTSNDDLFLAGSASSSALPSPNTLKKSATSRWKKGKKQIEVKPEFDLSSALPSSDNFRTSLLMPNLSARFSMLREQDDPNSLIGKASDDSVLQPRRKSRMMDYGFGGAHGLSDIAEVASIHGSFQPPFAMTRKNSESIASEDGYSSEVDPNQSMMSRARPGEGNNLFGGRQKVYRIPLTGANASSRSLGKAVYEDDIVVSPFQQSRQREREREARERRARELSDENHGFDFGLEHGAPGADSYLPHDSAKDLSHSPSLFSYDKKRSTASSITRSDTRSSTAATSVASQPVTSNTPSPAPGQTTSGATSPANVPASTGERSTTKTRRLYETGLEQNMYDQQHSAMSRLNSLQRPRGATNGKQTPPVLHNAKSASNLHERPPQQVYAVNGRSSPHGTQLPALSTSRQASSSNGPNSPASPLDDELNPLVYSIDAADRGKATAMGAFNKPKHAFDEDQYLQRQKQMQRSNSNAVLKPNQPIPGQTSVQSRLERFEQERKRSESSSSSRDRSVSGSKQDGPKAYDIFQNAASQLPAKPPAPQAPPGNRFPDPHRTFFGNISASESEEDDDDVNGSHSFQNDHGFAGYSNGKWQPSALPPVSEHPALRGQRQRDILEEEEEEEESVHEDLQPKPLRPTPSIKSLHDAARFNPVGMDVDSPTLGGPSAPLGSIMHHLRQKSNASSMYPFDDAPASREVPDVPDLPWHQNNSASNGRLRSPAGEPNSRHDSNYTSSNPWDLDERESMHLSVNSVSPVESSQRRMNLPNVSAERQSDVSLESSELPTRHKDGEFPHWQQEQRKQHTRDASTATLQEREAFENELAARRQAIQENMRSMVARSRENSPAPPSSGPFKGFGMLGKKPSREAMTSSPNLAQHPANKSLGKSMGAHPSTTSLHSQLAQDSTRPRGNSSPRPILGNNQFPSYSTEPMPEWDASRPRGDLPGERTLASATVATRTRSRSNSANTTGRSRSRTGPYRDDLDKAMFEGVGSSASGHPDISPLLSRELTPRPSPDVGSPHFDPSAANGSASYFDQKALSPLQTSISSRLPSAGASPVTTLSPTTYNPGRPVPVANPFSSNATPPLSGANTPNLSASSPAVANGLPNGVHPASHSRTATAGGTFIVGGGTLRKKTITKSDISEPTLIASTSNIDTVDLPEGASLKNGMDTVDGGAPPIPPINPKRRGTGARKIWGLGVVGGAVGHGDKNIPREEEFAAWRVPSSSSKSLSPPLNGSFPAHATLSRGLPSQQMQQQLNGYGGPVQSAHGSPERVERAGPPNQGITGMSMDGEMF